MIWYFGIGLVVALFFVIPSMVAVGRREGEPRAETWGLALFTGGLTVPIWGIVVISLIIVGLGTLLYLLFKRPILFIVKRWQNRRTPLIDFYERVFSDES